MTDKPPAPFTRDPRRPDGRWRLWIDHAPEDAAKLYAALLRIKAALDPALSWSEVLRRVVRAGVDRLDPLNRKEK